MRDIYEKILKNCSQKGKEAIEKHIEKVKEGKDKDPNYLRNSVGNPEYNYSIEDGDLIINFMPSTISFEIKVLFEGKKYKNDSFIFELSKNMNFEDSLEIFLLSLTIKGDKSGIFKAFYDYSKKDGLELFDTRTYRKDLKNYINLKDLNIMNVIIKNFCNPENLKDFSSIINEINYETDPILKSIYETSSLLDKINNLKIKNKSELK